MNESAGGRGSFILRSKTGKPEGPYENIEGNKDKAIFPNIDGSLFEDTDVYKRQDISYQQDLVGVLKENGYKTALVGKNHAYLKPADLDFWSEYGHWGKHKKTTPAEKETCLLYTSTGMGQFEILNPTVYQAKWEAVAKEINKILGMEGFGTYVPVTALSLIHILRFRHGPIVVLLFRR